MQKLFFLGFQFHPIGTLSDHLIQTSPRSRNEQIILFKLETGVIVEINAPSAEILDPNKPTDLVLYFLPNGNTINQTVGRTDGPGLFI